jgi:hypothetical protein
MAPAPFGPWIAVLTCFLLIPASASARQTTTQSPASDPQAVALATKALAALTGTVAIKDVTMTGTVTRTAGSDTASGTVTLKALGTTNSRLDLSTSSGTQSEVRNALNGPSGFWVGTDAVEHVMAGHNCMTDAVWFFPALSIVSQITNPNVIATYVGQETRNGVSVQHLHFTAALPNVPTTASAFVLSLTAEEIYLDSTSLLPIAMVFDTHPDNNAAINIPVEVDFSNYQSVSGVLAPLRIQQLLNNSLYLDISIESVTINSGLTESIFAE